MFNNILVNNKISKYRFAKMCDLPYMTINDLCLGKTDPDNCKAGTVKRIADTLGISMDVLMSGHEDDIVFDTESRTGGIVVVDDDYNAHLEFNYDDRLVVMDYPVSPRKEDLKYRHMFARLRIRTYVTENETKKHLREMLNK